MTPGRRILLAATAGAVLGASFLAGVGAAGLLAPAALWLAVRDAARLRTTLACGFLFGMAGFTLPVWWLHDCLRRHGELTTAWALAAMIALGVGLGLLGSALALLFRWTARSPFPALGAGAVWACLWLARAAGPAPFPWLPLSSGVFAAGGLRGGLSLFGAFGCDALLVFLTVRLAGTRFPPAGARHGRARPRLAWTALLALAALIAAPARPSRGPVSSFVIVQPAIAQSIKWAPGEVDAVHHRIVAAWEAAPSRPGALLVLPESCLPFGWREGSAFDHMLEDRVSTRRQAALLGLNQNLPDGRVANAAILFEPGQAQNPTYQKIVLTPFGEYVPMARLFKSARTLTANVGEFAPGRADRTVLDWSGRRLGMLICYEAVFPDASAQRAREGAGFLVNITNDGWFGHSQGPHQHFLLARMRAVETGLPLIRCANTGISALCLPDGRIEGRQGLETQGDREVQAPAGSPTFFARTQRGQDATWITLGALLAAWGWTRRRRTAPP